MRTVRQIARVTVAGLVLALAPVPSFVPAYLASSLSPFLGFSFFFLGSALSPFLGSAQAQAQAQQVPDFGAGPGGIPEAGSAIAADQLADIFSKVGDQLLEDCIFELSEEQVMVQYALVQAYVARGASGTIARRLAAAQIQPPKPSAKCEQVRGIRQVAPPQQEARLEPEAQPSPEAGASPEAPVTSEPEVVVPTPKAQPEAEASPSAPDVQTLTPEDRALAPEGIPVPKPVPAPKIAKAPEATQPAPEETQPEPQAAPLPWSTTTEPVPKAAQKPSVVALPKVNAPQPPAEPKGPQATAPVMSVVGKKPLPQWDCADGVDYVTIHLGGYERKLTGGEICSPFQDVVSELPASATGFRLGYTIKTGRLFVISDDPQISGKTIAWGLSGRDVCRNNPDPDCFAAKAVGPLPPGEYTFAAGKEYRVSYGPRTKRHVAGIFMTKLWNKERFSPAHIAAIKARGNIAIHMRLKGEMSEACIGLEPKGWAYVASLIKDERATGLNAYIDEPYPQVAEAPPVVVASGFSLTSLFK
jgi:hypothetical protein